MKTPWPVVILAVGLAFLFASISLVFGAAAASAVVGGAGVAYAALNVLLGKKKDDVTASQVLRRVFSVSKVTYAAAAAVWLGALGVAAVPIADEMLSEEFTVRVVDENRQPVEGARVDIGFDGDWSSVPLQRGVGTVKYYPRFTPPLALVRVRYQGADRTIRHQMDEDRRYDDLVVPVWSGQAMVSVSHFTASGLAIEPFLRGELPADLRPRFPRVRVMRNQVFETAQEVLQIYNVESWYPHLSYSRTDTDRAAGPRTTRRDIYVSGDGDPQVEAYLGRARSGRQVFPLFEAFALDFSQDVLGAPADRPLPAGFLARVNGATYWDWGVEALPDPETGARLRRLGSTARAPGGAVRIQLERLIGPREISYLLERGSPVSPSGPLDEQVLRYLRYMLAHNLPPGLIQGIVHIDPIDGCEYQLAQVQLHLPEPELRVTLLKNTGTTPLNLSEIVLSMQMRNGLQQASAAAPVEEIRAPFDQLEPGEAVLIPRELFFRSPYTDEQLAEFSRPPSGDAAGFQLLSRLVPDLVAADYPPSDGFSNRPRAIAISAGQLRVSSEFPASALESEDRQSAAYATRHSAYFLGPSVGEIDYVVNGARIRARSDRHTIIAMTGSVGEGSCPFVFARYRRGETPINLGQVIRRRIGHSARGRDRVAIPSGFRVLEIRELEDEVTYLDGAWLVVRSGQSERRYPAHNPYLGAEDGSYAILHQGDRVILSFDYIPRPGDGAISLEVSGYYDLVRRPGPAHAGHRRPTARIAR